MLVWLLSIEERATRGDAYVNIVHVDILSATIFKVLSKAADGHAVSSMARGVLYIDVVGSRLNSNAVVSSLVVEVGQVYVVHVHCV